MKTELRDIGIDLIPETEEEKATLERFWKGGVFLLGYGTSGRMTLSFADLQQPVSSSCLPQAYILEILSGLIDAIQEEKVALMKWQQRINEGPLGARWVVDIPWKRDFIDGLKILPDEFKKILKHED